MAYHNLSYSKSLYEGSNLKVLGKAYLEELPEDVTVLVSRGSSGTAIASAMLTLSDRELKNLYVRKSEEQSHGFSVSSIDYRPREDVFCIVDDFIDTGDTVLQILNRLQIHDRKIKVKYILAHHAYHHNIYEQFEEQMLALNIEIILLHT